MRGILMIEPLYHQTIAGNKTMTRRSSGLEEVNGRDAVKNKKGEKVKPAIITNPDEWEETGSAMVHTKSGIGLESVDFCNWKRTQQNVVCKPRYKVGEVLYIKEPISIEGVYMYSHPIEGRELLTWNNKLFMGAKDARAYVKITGIRCERLLDISKKDCIAEGIESDNRITTNNKYKRYLPACKYECVNYRVNAKDSFISLFRFANKIKPTVEIPNIWVWVYTFENFKK